MPPSNCKAFPGFLAQMCTLFIFLAQARPEVRPGFINSPLGPGFWGDRMQIYEPEWFRLILMFQSVDYTVIVQNEDNMTTCIRQYRKEQMDISYKIIEICPPLL